MKRADLRDENGVTIVEVMVLSLMLVVVTTMGVSGVGGALQKRYGNFENAFRGSRLPGSINNVCPTCGSQGNGTKKHPLTRAPSGGGDIE